MTVYKHYCIHGGDFYGVFVDVSHSCETEEGAEETKDAHECCGESGDNDLRVEEKCCTSNVSIYQMDTDLATNDIKVDFINHLDYSVSSFVLFSIPANRGVLISNKAPPALTTPGRLSLFQTYLI